MHERDLDLQKLLLTRDEVLSKYQARTSRWHALQAGALPALAGGVLGFFSGAFRTDFLLAIVLMAVAMLAVGSIAIGVLDATFERGMELLRSSIEMLKRKKVP